MAFVHLHNHTVFSMLDGATRIQATSWWSPIPRQTRASMPSM